MLRILGNAFAIPEIRRKIAFTAAMLALYRLGAYIPAPGVEASALNDLQSNFAGSNILGFLNLFSGGASRGCRCSRSGSCPTSRPRSSCSCCTVVVPSLEKLQKEGEVGQQKITQYTRYLTVVLAFAAVARLRLPVPVLRQLRRERRRQTLTFAKVMLIVISLTAGTVLLMWLGELITQRGIGNGISLMIFASIVSRLPRRHPGLVERTPIRCSS